jgi:hypothetical protein
MNMKRLSRNDWIVLFGFVLTRVGLSSAWYTISILSLSASLDGWHGAGIIVFLLTFMASAVVALKAIPSVTVILPVSEAAIVMVLGGVSVLLVVIKFLDKPGGMGVVGIGYGFGIFLTLVATILVTAGGYLKNSES